MTAPSELEVSKSKEIREPVDIQIDPQTQVEPLKNYTISDVLRSPSLLWNDSNFQEDVRIFFLDDENLRNLGWVFVFLLQTLFLFNLGYGSDVLFAICISVSIWNTLSFMWRTRTYQIPHFGLTEKVQSEHSLQLVNHPSQSSPVVQMHVWNPHPIQTLLFCFFSPLQLLLLSMGQTEDRLLLYGLVALSLGLLFRGVINLFGEREKDARFLFEQVYNQQDRYFQSFLKELAVQKRNPPTYSAWKKRHYSVQSSMLNQ